MLPPVDAPALFVAALVFGYLLGSIPFGVIFTRLAGTGDIRAMGSGNIGATNVLRTGRKGLAAATLLGDALKGTIAMLALTAFGTIPTRRSPPASAPSSGTCFRSGSSSRAARGSRPISVSCLRSPGRSASCSCVIWLAIAAITRYSSLAGLIASAAVPVALLFGGWQLAALLFVLLTVLLWVRHYENIARLLGGTESKIGRKVPAPPGA